MTIQKGFAVNYKPPQSHQYREIMLWAGTPYAVVFDLILAATLFFYFKNNLRLPDLAWTGILAITAVDLVRIGVSFFCRKRHIRWYKKATIVLNLIISTIWGLSLHYLLDQGGNPMVISMAAGILLAGYILAYSAHKSTLATAVLPMMALFFHGLLTETSQNYLAISGLLVLASLTFLGFTHRMLRTLESMVQQNSAQENTVQMLATEMTDIEQVNQQLQNEVQQRKEYQAEAERQRKRAEAANMAKDEFLATMSHEIRTPLNGILPILDLLSSTDLSPEQRDYLDTAIDSSRHLLRIIDDILDYSKIQAGKLELEIVGLNVREVIHSVVELMQPNAAAKGLELRYEIDPNVRMNMRGDPIRLRQILSNLVSNAIKFTEQGYVQIRVGVQRDLPNKQELLFQVKDTGIGIAPEVQPRLFRPFTQADASTSRLHGGTGLGLVICKRLVELMQGKIGVKSIPGKGSIFWFLIPLKKSAGDATPARTSLYGCRTLLVAPEHNEETRHISSLLEKAGLHLQHASHAGTALNQLQEQAKRGQFSELLVIDQRQLAEETDRLIEAVLAQEDLSWIPMLVITTPNEAERYRGREASISVLPTPINETRLVETLNLSLGIVGSTELGQPEPRHGARPPVTRAPESSMPAQSGMPDTSLLRQVSAGPTARTLEPEPPATGTGKGRALLVEDNPVNLKVAARLVENLGLSIDTAENGQIALDKISRNHYDLVFMDCQMPVMDGYQATRALRKREQERGLPRLPVIAMTANAMAGDRQKCLDSGMDDYLSKPIKKDLLQETIQRWLQRRPQPKNPAPAQPRPQTATTATDSETAASPILDETVVADLLEIMGDDFIELLEVYLRDAPKLVQQIRQAAAAGDIQQLISPAHSLKSSSANVGAMRLSELAKRMELGARQQQLENPAALAQKIGKTYLQTELALQRLIGKQ